MGFLYSQFFARLPYPTGSYVGKTVIITGSNTGLGQEAARHYARLGARKIILAVRNLDSGYTAKFDIEASTGCKDDVIQVWQIDMAKYASVEKFAARVGAELDRVDIVLANAGLARSSFSVAEDNETMMTVNVVSTLLLLALLLPSLKATAAKYNTRPTLSITSSSAAGHTAFPQKSAPEGQIFTSLNDKETYEKHKDDQYPISKLLQIFVVRAIGENYPKLPVSVNCVDPGLCHSGLGREFNSWGFWFIKLILARSTEAGSRTLIHAASEGVESHGRYLSDWYVVSLYTPIIPIVSDLE